MPTTRPVVQSAAVAIAIGLILGLGLQLPLSHALSENQQAHATRLLQAVQPWLYDASVRHDDLAEIDVLNHLRKVNDVTQVHKSSDGHFEIELSSRPLRQIRWSMWGRTWILMVIFGIAGGLSAKMARLRSQDICSRIRHRSRQQRDRFMKRRQRQEAWIQKDAMEWTRQAASFSNRGLILLDREQRVQLANPLATQALGLPDHPEGRHWLELQTNPAWAVALSETLTHPGEAISVTTHPAHPISLLTFHSGVTWIIVV